jgi:hypothetical protein
MLLPASATPPTSKAYPAIGPARRFQRTTPRRFRGEACGRPRRWQHQSAGFDRLGLRFEIPQTAEARRVREPSTSGSTSSRCGRISSSPAGPAGPGRASLVLEVFHREDAVVEAAQKRSSSSRRCSASRLVLRTSRRRHRRRTFRIHVGDGACRHRYSYPVGSALLAGCFVPFARWNNERTVGLRSGSASGRRRRDGCLVVLYEDMPISSTWPITGQ